MVAIIGHSKSIRSVLNYNEQKVRSGKATLIFSNKFPCDPGELSFKAKLRRFESLIERNPAAKTNTLHISLNFDPSEQIPGVTMQEIASRYMAAIGFDDQPYLVYRHSDAAHPHIHLVTTLIAANGSRINTHNIGRLKSEPARKAIEKEFGLVEAKGKRLTSAPAGLAAIAYGKQPTKAAIEEIVSFVVKEYRFTSLPELNAVLACFNVKADTGSEKSYLAKVGGLQFRMLDVHGKAVGVPIKSSALTGRPTLKKMQRLFEINKVLRRKNRNRLTGILEKIILDRQKITPDSLKAILGKWNISISIRANNEGRLYGVTYIDHTTRCVFKGSDLGKEFSANALSERLTYEKHTAPRDYVITNEKNAHSSTAFLTAMITYEDNNAQLSYELDIKRKGKKKKRKTNR